jgi:hypothetical protein
MHRYASKNKTNNTNNTNSNRNDQVKIYFPSISIQVLQHTLHGTLSQTQTHPPVQKQNKTKINTPKKEKIQLDKYLCSEIQKTIIYGTTSILEIHNNEPYAVYPSDKMILTSSIPTPIPIPTPTSTSTSRGKQPQQPQQLQLLVDYSTMKRSQGLSYQIPYDFKVHSCIVKKYRMTPKSDTCFVIEYKDNQIYDFYVLAKLSTLPISLSTNIIELDNFIKEDIISFLLVLNLY